MNELNNSNPSSSAVLVNYLSLISLREKLIRRLNELEHNRNEIQNRLDECYRELNKLDRRYSMINSYLEEKYLKLCI